MYLQFAPTVKEVEKEKGKVTIMVFFSRSPLFDGINY